MSWKNQLDYLVRRNIQNETSKNFGEMFNKIKVKEIMQYLAPTVFKEVRSTVEGIYRTLDRDGDKTAARELVTEMQRYSNFGYYFLLALQRLGLHELLVALSKNNGRLNPPNENSLQPEERKFFNEIFGFYRDQNPVVQLREPQADNATETAEPRKYEMPPDLTADPPSYEESERKNAVETIPKTIFCSNDRLLNGGSTQNDLDTERSRDHDTNTCAATEYNIPPNKLTSNSVNSPATSFSTVNYTESERQSQNNQHEQIQELSSIRSSEVQISINSDLEISHDSSMKKCDGNEASIRGHYEEPSGDSLKQIPGHSNGKNQKEFDKKIPVFAAAIFLLFGMLHYRYYKNNL